VIVGDYELQDVKSEISAPTGAQTIKIVPVIGGAKSSIGKIILGGILIYASFQMGFGTEGLTAMQGFGANMAMSLGVSLVMGGVAEMLAPTPQAPKETNLADNKSMGPINTTLQGVGIPVCYGQMIVGGATISAGVTTEDRSCIVVSDLLNLPGKFGEALNGSIFGAEGGLICPS
jgi:predicted phage tail protein